MAGSFSLLVMNTWLVLSPQASAVEVFRVPTPCSEVTKVAWNKWNTYSLAQKLDIPIPRTSSPRTVEEIDLIDAEFR